MASYLGHIRDGMLFSSERSMVPYLGQGTAQCLISARAEQNIAPYQNQGRAEHGTLLGSEQHEKVLWLSVQCATGTTLHLKWCRLLQCNSIVCSAALLSIVVCLTHAIVLQEWDAWSLVLFPSLWNFVVFTVMPGNGLLVRSLIPPLG